MTRGSSDDDDDEASNKTPKSASAAVTGVSAHSLPFTLLDFHDNLLTDLGVLVLSGFLARNPTVEQLNLGANYITDQGVANLKDWMSSAERGSMTKLDLSANQLTSLGVGFLVDALSSDASPKTKRFDLDLSGNEGIGTDGVAKLLTLKAATASSTTAKVSAVHFHQLSFSVYDPEILASRSLDPSQSSVANVASSPRASPSSASSKRSSLPAVSTITTSQQSVLNLFSPSVTNGNATTHMSYPAVSSAVAPTQSALMEVLGLSGASKSANAATTASAAPASAASTTTSTAAAAAGPPASKKKGDKKALENSVHAPRISISEKPVVGRVSVAPLHPPPAFTEPVASPDVHSTPISLSLPSPAPAALISHATPKNGLEDEDAVGEHDTGLLPTQMGDKKATPMMPK